MLTELAGWLRYLLTVALVHVQLVESVEGLVKNVQQSLDKATLRLKGEVSAKDGLQQQYDKLVEKQRKYFKLVKEFQAECQRNEKLGQ